MQKAGNIMLRKFMAQIGYGKVDQAIDADAVHRGVEIGQNGAVIAFIRSDRNVSEKGGGQRDKLVLAIQWRLG